MKATDEEEETNGVLIDTIMFNTYKAHPALAARRAAWHRQRAVECRSEGFLDHAVGHYDRADELEAILVRLVRCKRCGRALKHPDSVAAGIGPECAGKR